MFLPEQIRHSSVLCMLPATTVPGEPARGMRGGLLHHPQVQASCSGRAASAKPAAVQQRRVAPPLAPQPGSAGASCRPAGSMVPHAAPMATQELVDLDRQDHEAFMKQRADFLQEDLKHLFDDKGITKDQYDNVVEFRDPITKYDSVDGYMFNISLLRKVFAPTFQMHDLKRTGEYELTSRWTMIMQFTLNRFSPLQRWWDPQLIFTGVSIMGINKENGKFNRHIDLWDALKNNKYLSWEGVRHVAAQMGSLMRTPELPGPSYTILRKTKQYEIRRYDPFLVAEAAFDPAPGKSDPVAQGSQTFRDLAAFLFGKNDRRQKMSMTAPVLTDSRGTMQFALPQDVKDLQSLPAPEASSVKCRRNEGGLYGVSVFGGNATIEKALRHVRDLRQALQQDAVSGAADDWVLARYNDPSTRATFRRNEVMVQLSEFDLWKAGCYQT